jgi:hypothetical protein
MEKFLQDLFTEDDGATWCMARVCSFLGVLTFISAALIHVVHGFAINFNDFGIGFGALLAGCAAVIAGKAATQVKK